MILNAFNLKGKVAMVTGARTGLGQGMAFGLAEAGADIVGIDLTPLTETKKGVEERGGEISWNREKPLHSQGDRRGDFPRSPRV